MIIFYYWNYKKQDYKYKKFNTLDELKIFYKKYKNQIEIQYIEIILEKSKIICKQKHYCKPLKEMKENYNKE